MAWYVLKIPLVKLARMLVPAMAIVSVPLSLLVAVVSYFQKVNNGNDASIDWVRFGIGSLLELLAAFLYGVVVSLMLWIGWNVIDFIAKKAKRDNADPYGDDSVDDRAKADRYLYTADWFKNVFWGMLGFVVVFLPLTWLLAGMLTREGIGAQLDVLSMLSVLIAIPVLAFGGAAAIWLNVAIGAWILSKIRG